MASPHAQTVCVMDASSHLGINLVERLLERGYTIHAVIQNHEDLQPFKGYENKNLRIFRSDPFDYQSIMDAIKGCSGLFYTFEPPQDQLNYDESMTEVEVRAAHNVLEACAQTETMAKVVFTSSVTAAIWRENRNTTTADLDEKNWSDTNFCRNFKLWHALSKTVAEKTAWAMAMDRGLNMVSINAGLLTGPDLSIANPYLKGAAEMYEGGVLVTVDVKFLVDAHICVFEDPSTYGRYLCFNHLINRPEDSVKLAQMLVSATPYPQSCEDSRIFQQRISNKKLNKLMVDFTSGIQLKV
ncbi:cinnamoyl-CoA reductase-like SNL6 [Tasmannia lanceolata]|uniref:cinnamoyl-CoA reductase-like SNL6 n=1 Tax=Tasmannia lanceolata TaxID=3420 RepID=UPI0040633283